MFFGGSTLPLLKFLQPGRKGRRISSQGRSSRNRSGSRSQQKQKVVSLSKTKEFGQAIDSEHLSHSELTEEEEVQFTNSKLGGFARLDRKFFIPFFTRIFSNQVINFHRLNIKMKNQMTFFMFIFELIYLQELRDCKSQIVTLTDKWYQAIRVDNNSEDEEDDGAETMSQKTERTNSTATLSSSRGNII